MREENRVRCKPPLDDDEVETIWRGAMTQGDRPDFNQADTTDAADATEAMADIRFTDRLKARCGNDLLYSKHFGWLVWDGQRWSRDETEQVLALAKQEVRAPPSSNAALAPASPRTRELCETFLSLAQEDFSASPCSRELFRLPLLVPGEGRGEVQKVRKSLRQSDQGPLPARRLLRSLAPASPRTRRGGNGVRRLCKALLVGERVRKAGVRPQNRCLAFLVTSPSGRSRAPGPVFSPRPPGEVAEHEMRGG